MIQLSEDSETELQAFPSPIYERPEKRNNKEKQRTSLHCKTRSLQLTCREVFGFAAPRIDETQCSLDCLFVKLKGAQANSQGQKHILFHSTATTKSLLILHKVRGMEELSQRKS